jgi:hypothetical protein
MTRPWLTQSTGIESKEQVSPHPEHRPSGHNGIIQVL